MILTIASKTGPASDLGYLLHKNPSSVQSFDLSFGKAQVFYPESSEDYCRCALVLEVDSLALCRQANANKSTGFALSQYVNDRPYCASSFLSVAIAQVFGSALAGRSKERPELVEQTLDLCATVDVVYSPSETGEQLLHDIFAPLGYSVKTKGYVLDPRFPDWGKSPYYSLQLEAKTTLSSLLSHIYVLAPVLDNDKHYQVDTAEVEKLLRHGAGWLAGHPLKELITRRYLRHRRHLSDMALARLTEGENQPLDDEADEKEESSLEERISLNEMRHNAVLNCLLEAQAKRVIDLGCGEGRFLRSLADDKRFERLAGMDVSSRALAVAAKRLRQNDAVELFQGSLTYKDKRLKGFDAATCIEVIEHIDGNRLDAFSQVVFKQARPSLVIVTTPNIEYNVRFAALANGKLRHRDHRFEFNREQFQNWCQEQAQRFGYNVTFQPIGLVDEEVGAPTQMGVFRIVR